MIPPSGAREDSGDGLTGEATGTEQPPSPASTSSLESKVQRAYTGETQSPFPSDTFPLGSGCQKRWDSSLENWDPLDPLLLMLRQLRGPKPLQSFCLRSPSTLP